ncbi:MAG: glycosyltransferase family 4 protein [Myxococcota bacterium]|nr:glycosyltransferase family 4 protein [Myxococcota bacterium]
MITNLPDLKKYFDTLLLFAELSTRCNEVQLLTVHGQVLPEMIRHRYPRLRLITFPRRAWSRHALGWVQAAAARGEVDIIHDLLGSLCPFFILAPEDRKYRLVNTQLTTNWGWFDRVRHRGVGFSRHYIKNRVISLWRDRQLAHHADGLVVLGPGHEGDLLHVHKISPERISWIPAETDLEHFKPSPTEERQPGRLLFVGTSARTKGLPLLFSLMTTLLKDESIGAVELHLVGPVARHERRWFERAVHSAQLGDRLQLHPPKAREQLPAIYQRADLFLLPSLFEGSPRALREALACGCRAVVSELPGHRGIDPKGRFMSFAPDDQLMPWVDAVRALLTESPEAAESRRRRAYERLAAAHAPSAVAEAYLSLFERLLTEAPRRRSRSFPLSPSLL